MRRSSTVEWTFSRKETPDRFCDVVVPSFVHAADASWTLPGRFLEFLASQCFLTFDAHVRSTALGVESHAFD